MSANPVQQIYEYLESVESISELIGTANTAWQSMETAVQRSQVKALFIEREKALGGSGSQMRSVFNTIAREEKKTSLTTVRQRNREVFNINDFPFVTVDADGKPESTIANFESIMVNDSHYNNIHFNILGNFAEVHNVNHAAGRLNIRKWDDADEAMSKKYIEEQYGIYSDRKHLDALRILFKLRAYNPVMEILENIEWDGVERCEDFLHQWGKADDTPYVRECSRLIFAGGIWRMMEPGCKMDDVIVLIGSQGCGKSSLIRFLAIKDEYFGEIKTVEGATATEQLAGKWICEIPELAAFTRQKEVESVKAFITRQKDSYRKPYDRNVDDRPRYCIFVGSTNNPSFLVDLTGNRRFYPVHVNSDGYDVYKHELEIRQYIEQCWAEALAKYKKGEMPNYAKEGLRAEYVRNQDMATQDDWRVGAIEEYLSGKPVGGFVCVKELFVEVISPDKEHPLNPTPRDSKDVGIIMLKMQGWKKADRLYTTRYGRQRGWTKVEDVTIDYEPNTAESGGLPF